jgi:hypothetical protein
MPNGPWFPHPDTFSRTGIQRLPVGVWEIGNTASDHFFPTAPVALSYLGPHQLVPVPPGRRRGWCNGPADSKQSELYAALNLLFPV